MRAFDAANPRKDGAFELIDERKWDDSPEDEKRHDTTDQVAAFTLCDEAWPGKFGVYLETDRPSKNTLEWKSVEAAQEKVGSATTTELLRERFKKMQ